MIPWLGPDDEFPPLRRALREPNGLLAAGGDLSLTRVVQAYRNGIFPWYCEGQPILWWSPDPRMVLFVDEVHISRSLRRVIASRRFSLTMDTAFAAVMAGCAEPRLGQDGTWIIDAMYQAYERLAHLGLAHSIEVWEDGELAGGLYGVAIGGSSDAEVATQFTIK